MTPQKPSIGRIVLYRYHPNLDPLPGIITRAHNDGRVGLQVFGDPEGLGAGYYQAVSEGETVDTWHWPPRV